MKVFVLCLAVAGVLMGFSSALAAGAEEELAPGLSVSLDTSRASRPPQELPYFFSQFKDLLRQWWISEGQARLKQLSVEVSYGPGSFIPPLPASVVAHFGARRQIDDADDMILFVVGVVVDDNRGSFRRAAHILMDGARSGLKRWVQEREAELRRQELQKELREKLLPE